jgi:hypothetical protein
VHTSSSQGRRCTGKFQRYLASLPGNLSGGLRRAARTRHGRRSPTLLELLEERVMLSLPAGWADVDINGSTPAGSANYVSGVYTDVGGGTGFASGATSDKFNFANKSFSGDATLVARITSLASTSTEPMAGIAFRDSTSAGALFGALTVRYWDQVVGTTHTPRQEVDFSFRNSANGAIHTISWDLDSRLSAGQPIWLQIIRSGDLFMASYGTGTSQPTAWTNADVETIHMNSTALAGLAVTSGSTSYTATSTLDNVSLSQTVPASFFSWNTDSSPHAPQITVAQTDFSYNGTPTTLAWRAGHTDLTLNTGNIQGSFDMYMANNPTMRVDKYSLMMTVFQPTGNPTLGGDWNDDMQAWYATHPQYDIEDAFLHKNGVRMAVHIWDNDRWVLNPADPGNIAYSIDRLGRLIGDASGTFLDEYGTTSNLNGSDEFPVAADLQTAEINLLAALHAALPTKGIHPNNASYMNTFALNCALAAGGVNEEMALNPFSNPSTFFSYNNTLIAAGDYAQPVMSTKLGTMDSQYASGTGGFASFNPGNDVTPGGRLLVDAMAQYYLVVPAPNTNFALQWVSDSYSDSYTNWRNIEAVNIGAPQGTKYTYQSGTDPLGYTYSVYARNFDKALVLDRAHTDYSNVNDYGDNTAITVNLPTTDPVTGQPVSWKIVRSDGTLSASAVTSVQLRRVESVILMKVERLGTPATVANLTATATSSSQINLSWLNYSPDATHFLIERKTGAGGTYAQIASVSGSTTTYSDTNRSPGTTYYYRIRSQTGALVDSAYSLEANATTQGTLSVPAAPSGLTAAPASSSEIDLAWTDNSSNETGFEIDRATNNTFTTGLTTFTVGSNVTTYQSTGLSAGATYYYRVRATNSSGDSSNSNTASNTTQSQGSALVLQADKDTFVWSPESYYNLDNYGASTSMVAQRYSTDDGPVAMVGFNDANLDSSAAGASAATLTLTVAPSPTYHSETTGVYTDKTMTTNSDTITYEVFGMVDASSYSSGDAHENNWVEGARTGDAGHSGTPGEAIWYQSGTGSEVPGLNYSGSYSDIQGHFAAGSITDLGSFTLACNAAPGTTVNFSSADLLAFLNADTNDSVSFYIVAQTTEAKYTTTAFYTREGATEEENYALAPTLTITPNVAKVIQATKDTFVWSPESYYNLDNYGASTSMVAQRYGASDGPVAMVAFSDPDLDSSAASASAATLKLTVAPSPTYHSKTTTTYTDKTMTTNADTITYKVFGMVDVSSYSSGDAHENNWSEGIRTGDPGHSGTPGEAIWYQSGTGSEVPGLNYSGSYSDIQGHFAAGSITDLGSFTLACNAAPGTTVNFSSPALLDFLNADSNNNVSFYIVAQTTEAKYTTTAFYTREGAAAEGNDTLAPTLTITPTVSKVIEANKDTFVWTAEQYYNLDNYGASTSMVAQRYGASDGPVAMVGFSDPDLDSSAASASAATLTLTIAPSPTYHSKTTTTYTDNTLTTNSDIITYEVFGMVDASSYSSGDAHENNWVEGARTGDPGTSGTTGQAIWYQSGTGSEVPGLNYSGSYSDIQGHFAAGSITDLGSFTLACNAAPGTTVNFSNAALLNFLKADSNNSASFYIIAQTTEAKYTATAFYTREGATAQGDNALAPTLTIGSAMHLDVAPLTDSHAPKLNMALLSRVKRQAIAAWEAVGLTPAQTDALNHVQWTITDLPDGLLGETIGSQVLIDDNALGYGWSVGPHVSPNKVDLLTVLEHELGHVLGLPDLDPQSHPLDLMDDTLSVGKRLTISPYDVNVLKL